MKLFPKPTVLGRPKADSLSRPSRPAVYNHSSSALTTYISIGIAISCLKLQTILPIVEIACSLVGSHVQICLNEEHRAQTIALVLRSKECTVRKLVSSQRMTFDTRSNFIFSHH
jgi:hypothetical protein